MSRYCPNCNSRLYAGDCFFCTTCGYKLDISNLIYKDSFYTRYSYINYEKPIRKKIVIDKKVYYGFGLLVIVSLLIFSGVHLSQIIVSKRKVDTVANVVLPKREYENNIYTNLDLKSGSFKENDLYGYIPYNVDFYLEGHDFNLIKNLLNSSYLESQVFMNFLDSFKGPFALFGRKEGDWNISLVLVLNEGSLIEIPSELDTHLFFRQIGDALIISEKESYLEDSNQAYNKIVRNVSQLPKFSINRPLLPEKGQIMFMHFDQDLEEVYNLLEFYDLNESLNIVFRNLKNASLTNFVLSKNE